MFKFAVGDEVYVPTNRVAPGQRGEFALQRATVQEVRDRSVRLNRQYERGDDIWVASRLLRDRALGITILRIGDLDTEDHTLDPLAKSTLHYLRLLLEPDAVHMREIRTAVELQMVWTQLAKTTSHLLLIGHGDMNSMSLLGEPKPTSGQQLGNMLSADGNFGASKTVVSLSCLTGHAGFGKNFSSAPVCGDYIAPFHSVHSAAASLYAQCFFANHLLNGMGVVAAHRRARAVCSGVGVSFRHWRNGSMLSE